MASPSDENENKPEVEVEVDQGDDVQETRELGPEGSGSSSKSKQILIGILSLVVFFTLLFVFRGEEEPSVEENLDIGTSIESESTALSPGSPPEKSAKADLPKSEPSAGQVLIQTEETRVINPPPPPKDVTEKAENKIIPIPQEELVFVDPFDPNKANRTKKKKTQSSAPAPKAPVTKKPKPVKMPKVSRKKPHVAVKKVARKKTTRPNPVKQGDHLYAIQLGAFKEKNGAEGMADRLRKGGFDAYVLTEKGQLFRVRVGDFKSRGEAKKVAGRIRKAEKLDSFITVD